MLKDKVAIVTGGTRGIGLEIVRTFLKNGAKVALLGSKEETVNKALEELKKENESYEVIGFHPCLYKESEVEEVFKNVNKEFKKVDIVVNNAGMSSSTPLTNYTEEEYDKISNLNIKSVFVVSKVAVPYLEKTKGVIINTSSMVSIYGQPSGVMYPASKFAVNGMTKSLARELAPKGIRVNAVAPGITETEMVAALPKEMIEPLIKSIPLGRIGTPQDIANAMLFLASDLASYITGEILSVDGAARN
ncbi:MAG: 3-oxoacyl-ACP reductase FabG [Bacilli bacterium]|nr:3-oxoacyl-ACP reductase FabG [Bacilli bacterium]